MNPIQGLRILPAEPQMPTRATGAAQPAGESSGFLDTLGRAIEQVDDLQGQAQQTVANLLTGNGGEVHSAMIAVEKADLSFQLMLQVRNKIVQAYQEISRLQF